MGKPVNRLFDRETIGAQRASDRSISFGIVFLNEWLKNAKATRSFPAVVVLLSTLLNACANERWSAFQLSEGIVFETEHSMADFVELQKAHLSCQRAGEVGLWSSGLYEQSRATEKTQGGFCESVASRTAAHPGSVENAYQLWMRGRTRELSDRTGGEGLGGEDL